PSAGPPATGTCSPPRRRSRRRPWWPPRRTPSTSAAWPPTSSSTPGWSRPPGPTAASATRSARPTWARPATWPTSRCCRGPTWCAGRASGASPRPRTASAGRAPAWGPACRLVRREGERRIAQATNSVGGPVTVLAVVLLVVALAVVVGCSILMAGRTRRLVQPAVLVATLLAAGALAVVVNGIRLQTRELREAAGGDIEAYVL